MVRRLTVRVPGPGLHEFTQEVAALVREAGIDQGLCTLFIEHTSASLVVQENADPSAKRDLESFLARLAPEGDPRYSHTLEGPDDMPAHIRAALTATSLSIPVLDGRLTLGPWQGIYLWEHRRGANARTVAVHIGS